MPSLIFSFKIVVVDYQYSMAQKKFYKILSASAEGLWLMAAGRGKYGGDFSKSH
jgi:hypothetical protein